MNQLYLYYGDNLQVFREHIATESVDLIHLGPPFNCRAGFGIYMGKLSRRFLIKETL
jgi:hypothetical protein